MDKAKDSNTELSEDKYKSSGQIVFRMAEFKAFSKGNGPKKVYGAITEHINGLPWRIGAKRQEDVLVLFLRCDGDSNDMAWSCHANYQLSIVSFTTNDEFLTTEENCVFTAHAHSWGCCFDEFEVDELMDPKNGIYDEKGDAMTFKAQITAERPRGMAEIRTADPLLVNGKVVHVNKHNLSMHSEFFHNLFFGPMAEQLPSVQIDDIDDAVGCVERLIATMPPQNLELDDDCVENVLHLANRFLMDSVENRCVSFLMNKSKKLAICKFRLAHQYGISGMKQQILKNLTKLDFAGKKFAENCSYIFNLDATAVYELLARHTELFGIK